MKTHSIGEEEEDDDSESQRPIKMLQVSANLLASMQQKVHELPRLLNNSAGRSSCCIYRVPESLIDINGRSYQPHVISIGPYHHGQPHLRMIQEHKWRFLGTLLDRSQAQTGRSLKDYLQAVQALEAQARECYSETIPLSSDDLVELLVLDSCFIIELFRKIAGLVPFEDDDPLMSMSWIYSFFLRDLVRLENQIPFFVLQCLFDLTQPPDDEISPSLATLALKFFNNTLQRPNEVIAKYGDRRDAKHLLELLRMSFIPETKQNPRNGDSGPTRLIQSISKLGRAGIKLRWAEADSFLVVEFRHGAIHMPTITVDDFMRSFMLNCVAYEQCCRGCSKHFTTYATLLDSLINTWKDVEHLCDKNIVENYFGTDTEVALFINNLGKDVTFDVDDCYLSELFNEVNEYYHNGWHVQWASFKYTYFNTPWSFISALAALILLILTIVQTLFSVIAYVRPAH